MIDEFMKGRKSGRVCRLLSAKVRKARRGRAKEGEQGKSMREGKNGREEGAAVIMIRKQVNKEVRIEGVT